MKRKRPRGIDWSNHSDVKNAISRWLESQRGVEVLPIGSWLAPLKIDVLVKRPCPEELCIFELYEARARARVKSLFFR